MQTGTSRVKYRNPFLVLLLSILFPVIFWAIWYVATSNELKRSEVGDPGSWAGIVGTLVFGIIVAVFWELESILPGMLGVLFLILFMLAMIALYLFVVVTATGYWRSVKMVTNRDNDDYVYALVCGFMVWLAWILEAISPILLLIPILPIAILILLAQIELNGYARTIENN